MSKAAAPVEASDEGSLVLTARDTLTTMHPVLKKCAKGSSAETHKTTGHRWSQCRVRECLRVSVDPKDPMGPIVARTRHLRRVLFLGSLLELPGSLSACSRGPPVLQKGEVRVVNFKC